MLPNHAFKLAAWARAPPRSRRIGPDRCSQKPKESRGSPSPSRTVSTGRSRGRRTPDGRRDSLRSPETGRAESRTGRLRAPGGRRACPVLRWGRRGALCSPRRSWGSGASVRESGPRPGRLEDRRGGPRLPGHTGQRPQRKKPMIRSSPPCKPCCSAELGNMSKSEGESRGSSALLARSSSTGCAPWAPTEPPPASERARSDAHGPGRGRPSQPRAGHAQRCGRKDQPMAPRRSVAGVKT